MTSKQRAYLRSLAMTENTIFQVGKGGINDNQIKQISEALEARELVKISVLETAPEFASELGNVLAERTDSELVQIIGSKITLYRPRKKDPKIILPM